MMANARIAKLLIRMPTGNCIVMHCPATAYIRQKHMEAVKALEKNLDWIWIPLPSVHPSTELIMSGMHHRALDLDRRANIETNRPLIFYTDGSCDNPDLPLCDNPDLPLYRRAAWGIVQKVDHRCNDPSVNDFKPVKLSHVSGKQSETIPCKWKAEHPKGGIAGYCLAR